MWLDVLLNPMRRRATSRLAGRSNRRPRRTLVAERMECRRAPTITIDVGDHVLAANRPDQVIELYAQGTDEVTGMNIRARISSGAATAPTFQQVEFSDGEAGFPYVWDVRPVTTQEQLLGSAAQVSVLFTATGDVVSAQGLLARLTIDTTGVHEGIFQLNLDDELIGKPTDFILPDAVELVPVIVNGSILINPHPWHNLLNAEDVDGDGNVFPIDALRVINELNRRGIGPLPVPVTAEEQPPPYLDVMPDDQLQPIDALVVINRLNEQVTGENGAGENGAGEAEGAGRDVSQLEGRSTRAALDPCLPR